MEWWIIVSEMHGEQRKRIQYLKQQILRVFIGFVCDFGFWAQFLDLLVHFLGFLVSHAL